eukprot:TRINITY_DN26714_c0_g1_i1.p1 TRINITY_DN26714_c0_g1~~TRINITY_DN26714_c0_g1_i1.p1  ORF type:complete len:373 (-),score=80.28 TRINITY_DN26714_c0_g1_i1:140-1258(-)
MPPRAAADVSRRWPALPSVTLALTVLVRAALGRERCSDGLLIAARYGDVEQIRTSLQTENVNCTDDERRTPLHAAAAAGQSEAALELLAAGALMDRDLWGRAPLHSATIAGQQAMAELLLDSGAYVELIDHASRTPLHFAARQGHVALAKLFLDRGAKLDVKDMNERTPLHFSTRGDELINVTRLLLARGANVSSEDATGYTALHVACKGNQADTVELLLGNDADLYSMDKAGWNPLVHAAAAGHSSLVNWLVVRMLRPKSFPTPDPAGFLNYSLDQEYFGMSAWILALVFSGAAAVLILCPACYVLRRFAKLHRQYSHGRQESDAAIEDFVATIFDKVAEKRGKSADIAKEWDSVPAHTLQDLHRVRGNHV